MAKSPKLKVYRTPIGFHDAYVAAASQKAALEAWGTDTNLFARGAAELVTDPALTEAPLTQPGVVVKRLRGTEAEQIAALPPDTPPRTPSAPAERAKLRPKPKPSRALLDKAEAALAEAQAAEEAENAALAQRRAALDAEQRALDRRHEAARERLERARDEARSAYEAAMRAWEG